ncbi:MAG: hypothetical protein PF447_04235 [Spirochaetaceae bacterium]|jgi:hypothetical protein|nr:hypothetical protein [Spirochaetaceae bacterium]
MKMKGLLVILIMTMVMFNFVGCDGFFAAVETLLTVTNVNGSVVNAMQEATETVDQFKGEGDATLVGAMISFYPTNADGTYSDTVQTSVTVGESGT